jgi:hypothetical protein
MHLSIGSVFNAGSEVTLHAEQSASRSWHQCCYTHAPRTAILYACCLCSLCHSAEWSASRRMWPTWEQSCKHNSRRTAAGP